MYHVIEIINREPLKIGAGGNKANQIEPSKDHIPGSTIRGAIIRELDRRDMFQKQKNQVLLGMYCYNAYPFGQEELFVPAPFHLRVNKHEWRKNKMLKAEVAPVYELSSNSSGQAHNELEYRYVAIKDDRLIGTKVEKEYRLHHNTHKKHDEQKRENLFRYQAIAPGCVFRSLIQYDDQLYDCFQNIFKESLFLYLGGSKGSGYGLCEVRAIGEAADVEKANHILGLTYKRMSHPEYLQITCLSDSLFRNEYGQPVPYIPESYIEYLTGMKVYREDRQYIQSGLTEGYNATWRARYPKETTLKAGSVLWYRWKERPNDLQFQEIIKKMEGRLHGFRTNDGYGWLAVNWIYPYQLQIEPVNCHRELHLKSEIHMSPSEQLEEERTQTVSILFQGLEPAKKRWLNYICSRLLEEGDRQTEHVHTLVISQHLKSTQLQRMEEVLKEKKYGEFMERPYHKDNQMLSINRCNFIEIITYLRNQENSRLTSFAQHYLNERKGSLLYHDKEDKEREFIRELLIEALYIRRREKE